MNYEDMTNEQLAARIKQGDNDNLIPVLWGNVQKLMYLKSDKAYEAYAECCKRHGVELWDIRQSSYMAFLQALKGYDSTKGYKFTAYLSYPFMNIIAELLGRRGSGKNNLLDECESFEKVIGGADDDLLLIDTIKDENAIDVQELLDIQSDGDLIRREVEKLLPLQRTVIKMHYFEGIPFSEIAEKHAVSYSYILQVRNQAFRMLRNSRDMCRLFHEMNFEHHSRGFIKPDEFYLKYHNTTY